MDGQSGEGPVTALNREGQGGREEGDDHYMHFMIFITHIKVNGDHKSLWDRWSIIVILLIKTNDINTENHGTLSTKLH